MKVIFSKPIPDPKSLTTLFSGKAVEDHMSDLLRTFPDLAEKVLALEEPYRVDQLVLVECGCAGSLERPHEGAMIQYNDGLLSKEKIQKFLKANKLPTLKDYIDLTDESFRK